MINTMEALYRNRRDQIAIWMVVAPVLVVAAVAAGLAVSAALNRKLGGSPVGLAVFLLPLVAFLASFISPIVATSTRTRSFVFVGAVFNFLLLLAMLIALYLVT